MTDLEERASEVFAESMAFRALERGFEAAIADRSLNDEEIKLSDDFLCLMRETKKKCLEKLKKREVKK